MVRKKLSAEADRTFFRQVVLADSAYFEPWVLGESLLIANANAKQNVTMQHRSA